MSQNSKQHIAYLHAFRGIAIITIVGAHSWSFLSNFANARETMPHFLWLYGLTESIFHGSTIFFALISGLLYSRVLHGRPWRQFFVSKGQNVVLPYLLFSLLFTWMFWQYIFMDAQQNGRSTDTLDIVVRVLLTGSAQMHYWYIPVLCLLYVLTPLLCLMNSRFSVGWPLIVLAAAPLCISRTQFPDLLSWQSFVYFLGVYGVGIWMGTRLDQCFAFVERYRAYVWMFILALTMGIFGLYLMQYEAGRVFSFLQSLIYLQKTVFSLLLLYIFMQQNDKLPVFLKALATYSFTIYFIHMLAVYPLSMFVSSIFDGSLNIYGLAGLGLLVLVLTLALSFGVAWVSKKIFRRYSRMIVGA